MDKVYNVQQVKRRLAWEIGPASSPTRPVTKVQSVTTGRTVPGILLAISQSQSQIAATPPPAATAAVAVKPAKPRATKTRYDTSLGQLTKKFITLLKQAPEGVSGTLLVTISLC